MCVCVSVVYVYLAVCMAVGRSDRLYVCLSSSPEPQYNPKIGRIGMNYLWVLNDTFWILVSGIAGCH